MIQKKTNIILLTIFVLSLGACSVEKNYRVLSFFFDGVPDPGIENIIHNTGDEEPGTDTPATDTLALTPVIYYHEPYLEKNCNSCHNWRNMGENIGENLALCFSCHEKFSNSYKYTHGPAAAGYCSECHHPHKSDIEHLLLKEESEVCTNCHDHRSITDSRYHLYSDIRNCLICHNPHGSNNHLLVRSEACFQCHDDFRRTLDPLHGPVAAGNCSVCHSAHSDTTGKKLNREGRGLCLFCHDTPGFTSNEYHSGTEEMACTDCHNPHEGIRR